MQSASRSNNRQGSMNSPSKYSKGVLSQQKQGYSQQLQAKRNFNKSDGYRQYLNQVGINSPTRNNMHSPKTTNKGEFINKSHPKDQSQMSTMITQVNKGEKGNRPIAGQPQTTRVKGSTLLTQQIDRVKGRKTLILDLDETLVHSQFKNNGQQDITLPVDIDGVINYVYVSVRPYTDQFIREVAQYYEVVIFTASLSKYADPLMDILDPDRRCTARLFREHCTFHNGVFVKDLARLNRDLKDIIIVDNSPTAYLLQPENALPCISWYDDRQDRNLLDLLPILKRLASVEDVRNSLSKFVINDKVEFLQAAQFLSECIEKETKESKREISNNQNSNSPQSRIMPANGSVDQSPNKGIKSSQPNEWKPKQQNTHNGLKQIESEKKVQTFQDLSQPLMNTWTSSAGQDLMRTLNRVQNKNNSAELKTIKQEEDESFSASKIAPLVTNQRLSDVSCKPPRASKIQQKNIKHFQRPSTGKETQSPTQKKHVQLNNNPVAQSINNSSDNQYSFNFFKQHYQQIKEEHAQRNKAQNQNEGITMDPPKDGPQNTRYQTLDESLERGSVSSPKGNSHHHKQSQPSQPHQRLDESLVNQSIERAQKSMIFTQITPTKPSNSHHRQTYSTGKGLNGSIQNQRLASANIGAHQSHHSVSGGVNGVQGMSKELIKKGTPRNVPIGISQQQQQQQKALFEFKNKFDQTPKSRTHGLDGKSNSARNNSQSSAIGIKSNRQPSMPNESLRQQLNLNSPKGGQGQVQQKNSSLIQGQSFLKQPKPVSNFEAGSSLMHSIMKTQQENRLQYQQQQSRRYSKPPQAANTGNIQPIRSSRGVPTENKVRPVSNSANRTNKGKEQSSTNNGGSGMKVIYANATTEIPISAFQALTPSGQKQSSNINQIISQLDRANNSNQLFNFEHRGSKASGQVVGSNNKKQEPQTTRANKNQMFMFNTGSNGTGGRVSGGKKY